MAYSFVVFDMDGTVLDTLSDLTTSLNHALDLHNMPSRSLDEVRSFVGNGIGLLVARGVKSGTSEAETRQVLADFLSYYNLHCNDQTRPYEGIPTLLHRLKAAGIKTALVSNKDHFAVQKLCDLYFPQLFDFVLGVQECRPKKPAPDMVLYALQALHADRNKAVYVGDSEVDLQTAANAGLPCICVGWGFRSKEAQQKAGGNIFAANPEKLTQLLLA